MRNLFARLLGFSALPMASSFAPLLMLPILARVGGAEQWAAFAVGQAVGTFAATLCFAGWNALGTPLVVQSKDPVESLELYRRSLSIRTALCFVAVPVAMAVAWFLAPANNGITAAAFAACFTLTALTMAWFGIGMSSPAMIAKYDVAPRLVATVAAIPLVYFLGQSFWYAFTLGSATLVGLALFHRTQFGQSWPFWIGLREVVSGLAAFRESWLVEITSSLYGNSPVMLAGLLLVASDTASYASGDKLYRYSLPAVIVLGNAMQGWIFEAPAGSRRRRHAAAILSHLTLGLVVGLGLALVGAPATRLLFGDAVAANPGTVLWLGIAFLAISTATPLSRNLLMPARRERFVLVATVSGALVGIPTMIVLAGQLGDAGISLGMAISESTVLLIEIVGCVTLLRRARSGTAPLAPATPVADKNP